MLSIDLILDCRIIVAYTPKKINNLSPDVRTNIPHDKRTKAIDYQ